MRSYKSKSQHTVDSVKAAELRQAVCVLQLLPRAEAKQGKKALSSLLSPHKDKIVNKKGSQTNDSFLKKNVNNSRQNIIKYLSSMSGSSPSIQSYKKILLCVDGLAPPSVRPKTVLSIETLWKAGGPYAQRSSKESYYQQQQQQQQSQQQQQQYQQSDIFPAKLDDTLTRSSQKSVCVSFRDSSEKQKKQLSLQRIDQVYPVKVFDDYDILEQENTHSEFKMSALEEMQCTQAITPNRTNRMKDVQSDKFQKEIEQDTPQDFGTNQPFCKYESYLSQQKKNNLLQLGMFTNSFKTELFGSQIDQAIKLKKQLPKVQNSKVNSLQLKHADFMMPDTVSSTQREFGEMRKSLVTQMMARSYRYKQDTNERARPLSNNKSKVLIDLLGGSRGTNERNAANELPKNLLQEWQKTATSRETEKKHKKYIKSKDYAF